jgi:uncharacterized protein (TIGR00251 family)
MFYQLFYMKISKKFIDEFTSEGVLYLNIKVIPKAQKTELVELMKGPDGEDVLKVKVAAAPEKGKANKALCDYIAQIFEVSKAQVVVVRGQTSQRKVLKIVTR